VELRRLWLRDFRNYPSLDLELGAGCTLIMGENGQGKTNLVEAVAALATVDSFRGATTDALVRDGAVAAVVRGVVAHDEREILIEVEFPRQGRVRAQLNGQPLRRARDLLGGLAVTVFSPDDLVLVKGGPGERRRFLDDAVVALHPAHDAVRADFDRILRQRNALLRQAGGRLRDEVAFTLDVWDERLAAVGERLADLRRSTLAALAPWVTDAYRSLASTTVDVGLVYEASWTATGLRAALAESRRDDVRRGVTLVGPHRDDVGVSLEDRPARSRASQGEQRCLALALRLATHHLVNEHLGTPPLLILDDVLSELDPGRSAALLAHLPVGQVLMTTAGPPPPGAHPDTVVHVSAGTVR